MISSCFHQKLSVYVFFLPKSFNRNIGLMLIFLKYL